MIRPGDDDNDEPTLDDEQPAPPGAPKGVMRLQRYLALAGLGARRKMETVISEGRVTINGTVATLGAKCDPDADSIKLDGKRVRLEEHHVYLALNKPEHTLTSVSDDRQRPLVMALIPDKWRHRVHPVGRLDFESEGLLLFTTDGELTLKLTHPRYKLFKTYWVKVHGAPKENDLDKIRRGMALEGRRTLPMIIGPLKRKFGAKATASNTWLEVKMVEGRKNQIRELFFRINHPVIRLVRVAVGPVQLGELPPGAVRTLSPAEVEALKTAPPDALPVPPPRKFPVSGVRAAQEKLGEADAVRPLRPRAARPAYRENAPPRAGAPRREGPREERRPGRPFSPAPRDGEIRRGPPRGADDRPRAPFRSRPPAREDGPRREFPRSDERRPARPFRPGPPRDGDARRGPPRDGDRPRAPFRGRPPAREDGPRREFPRSDERRPSRPFRPGPPGSRPPRRDDGPRREFPRSSDRRPAGPGGFGRDTDRRGPPRGRPPQRDGAPRRDDRPGSGPRPFAPRRPGSGPRPSGAGPRRGPPVRGGRKPR